MAKGKGIAFEELLEAMFRQYEKQGIAKIHKVDPPVRMVGRRPVFLPGNPWLDFAGTWTAENGRSVIIEAKSTKDRRLRIERTGGITHRQWQRLVEWRDAGAATFIVWGHGDRIRIVTLEIVAAAIASSKRVSIQWRDALPCLPGTGYATQDVLATARHLTDQARCVKNGS